MAIYARLENGTYAEVTGVYKADGTEVTEIFQGDRLVYSASNEIYGDLPLYYNGKGYDLTDYLISGNTVQDRTPSPEDPVDATGSGVRTENLFDADATNTNNGFVDSGYLYDTGEVSTTSQYFVSEYIPARPNTEYTLLYSVSAINAPSVCFYDSSKSFISGERYGGRNPVTFTTPNGTAFIRISGVDSRRRSTMLNLGSTALPYEPYGYKLPLTVNDTEYPIYLGQVETTRRIKKLVLTGEESYVYQSQYTRYLFTIRDAFADGTRNTQCFCTHYQSIYNGEPIADVPNNSIYINQQATGTQFCIKDESITSVDDFKSYLASQYAAGTPVTVWYVLAKPKIAVVNEPLHKIGDYADTVSFAQAGVVIPTVNGSNTLDMASPVKPSEMYIKGKGVKPTGYGQLVDVNSVNILDKDGMPIYVHGQ